MKITYRAQIFDKKGHLIGLIDHEDKETFEHLLRRFLGKNPNGWSTHTTSVYDCDQAIRRYI